MESKLSTYETNPFIGEKTFELWDAQRKRRLKLFAHIDKPGFYINKSNGCQLLDFRFIVYGLDHSRFYLTFDLDINGVQYQHILKGEDLKLVHAAQSYTVDFCTPIPEPKNKSKVIVKWKIQYHYQYICSLFRQNPDCTCYLNSALLLLFRLTKFRSLLFNNQITSQFSPHWVYQLSVLFKRMCNSSNPVETTDLTKAFGWPRIACRIQHDLSDFLFILLSQLSNTPLKKELDDIFLLKLSSATNESEIEELYIIEIKDQRRCQNSTSCAEIQSSPHTVPHHQNDQLGGTPIADIMALTLQGQKFHHFPEVLIISNNSESLMILSETLDLTEYAADDANTINGDYKLVGFSQLQKINSGGHYTTLCRLIDGDAWMHFNDSITRDYLPKACLFPQGFQGGFKIVEEEFFKYNSSQRGISRREKTRLAVYVAKSVFGQYFKFSPNSHLLSSANYVISHTAPDQREIQIITDDDVQTHVSLGHTDFKLFSQSFIFVVNKNVTNREIYQRVADEKQLNINQFILRYSKHATGAPDIGCLIPDQSQSMSITKFRKQRFYLEMIPENTDLGNYTVNHIPLFFLHFKFEPETIRYNLATRSYLEKKNEPQSLKDLNCESTKIDPILKLQMEKKNSIGPPPKHKCLTLLDKIIMNKSNNLASVIPQLMNKLKVDNSIKLNLYTAVYKEKLKIGYKPLDLSIPLNSNPDLTSGMYIYVQILENFTFKAIHQLYPRSCSNDELSTTVLKTERSAELADLSSQEASDILPKSFSFSLDSFIVKQFIFFKYYSEIHTNIFINPTELPNVYLMERFSIPIEFCKFSSHTKSSKSLLFPITIRMTIPLLKQFICRLMNEEVPANGAMQLFFGFKQGNIPFSSPIPDLKYDTHQPALFQNVFYFPLNLNLATDKDLPEFYFECQPEIQIHYVIFPFVPKSAVHATCSVRSFRLYFSEDGLTVKYIRQVLKTDDKMTVEQIMNSLLNIFVVDNNENNSVLSEYDQEKLNEIKLHCNEKINSLPYYSKYYRVLQIKNSMISKDNVEPKSIPYNEIEYRIERIPIYDSIKPISHVRVSYGAQYNKTQYIAPLGIPFLFDVFQDEMDPSNFINEETFIQTKIYQRLLSRIKYKNPDDQFEFIVINFTGIRQPIHYYQFDKIVNDAEHLHLSICIKRINSSQFVDPEILFSTIKIIE